MEEIFRDERMSIKNSLVNDWCKSLNCEDGDYEICVKNDTACDMTQDFFAGVKAAVQYLEGECKEHSYKDSELYSGDDGKLTSYIGMKEVSRYFFHRRDCPDCMTEIKKSLEI